MTRIAAITLCIALLAACGGGGISLDDLSGKEAHATCDAVTRCFGPASASAFGGTNCEAHLTHQFTNSSVALIKQEVAAGRAIYHGDQAQSCFDAIAAADCTTIEMIQDIPACKNIVEGTVALGAGCTTDVDCMGDAYCDQSAGCAGTCTARAAAGHACTTTTSCQAGLSCDSSVCTAPASMGMPCEGPSGPHCGFALVCMGATGTAPGTCVTYQSLMTAASGAACNPLAGPYCTGTLSCAAQSATSYVCEGTVAAGAACKIAIPDECPDGQYCAVMGMTLTGTCTALPAEGQPCLASTTVTGARCVADLVCVGRTGTAPGTCKAPVDNGGSCTTAAECWSGGCSMGVCAPVTCTM